MAELLTARLGRPIAPANLRQLLHRARERFAELLLDDIRESLEDAPAGARRGGTRGIEPAQVLQGRPGEAAGVKAGATSGARVGKSSGE